MKRMFEIHLLTDHFSTFITRFSHLLSTFAFHHAYCLLLPFFYISNPHPLFPSLRFLYICRISCLTSNHYPHSPPQLLPCHFSLLCPINMSQLYTFTPNFHSQHYSPLLNLTFFFSPSSRSNRQ